MNKKEKKLFVEALLSIPKVTKGWEGRMKIVEKRNQKYFESQERKSKYRIKK